MAMQELGQLRRIPIGRPRPLIDALGPGDRIKTKPQDGTETKRPIYIHDPKGILVFGSANVEIVRKS